MTTPPVSRVAYLQLLAENEQLRARIRDLEAPEHPEELTSEQEMQEQLRELHRHNAHLGYAWWND